MKKDRTGILNPYFEHPSDNNPTDLKLEAEYREESVLRCAGGNSQ